MSKKKVEFGGPNSPVRPPGAKPVERGKLATTVVTPAVVVPAKAASIPGRTNAAPPIKKKKKPKTFLQHLMCCFAPECEDEIELAMPLLVDAERVKLTLQTRCYLTSILSTPSLLKLFLDDGQEESMVELVEVFEDVLHRIRPEWTSREICDVLRSTTPPDAFATPFRAILLDRKYQSKPPHTHRQHECARIMTILYDIDDDVTGTVNLSEGFTFMERLGIPIKHADFKILFDEHDVNLNEVLEIDEFFKLFLYIGESTELSEVFQRYASQNARQVMTSNDLLNFLQKEQSEHSLDAAVKTVIVMTRAKKEDITKIKITTHYFMRFLRSSVDNAWTVPVGNAPTQNMGLPLVDYFIYSASKVIDVTRALLDGVRMIEIELKSIPKDGPCAQNGAVGVWVPFQTVCESILENAFKASDFGVILSLNVFSLVSAQQKIVAQIVAKSFGSALLTREQQGKHAVVAPTSMRKMIALKLFESIDGETNPSCAELTKLMFFNGVKINGLAAPPATASDHKKVTHIASLAFDSRITSPQVQAMSSQYVIRSYGGSAKPVQPMPCWVAGICLPMVDHNIKDPASRLVHARFQSNGRTGYVMKPPTLTPNQMKKKSISMLIISATQLPRAQDKQTKTCVYVEVTVLGVPSDDTQKDPFKTATLQDRWHPIWNVTCGLSASQPELAMIRLRLMHFDALGSDEILAESCVPYSLLREGYRSVGPLVDATGRPLPDATVMVKINFL